MSDKLAISSAFSVLMMASYALLGPEAARVELGAPNGAQVAVAVVKALPQASAAVLLRD